MPFLCQDSQDIDVQKGGLCYSPALDIQGVRRKCLQRTFATAGDSGIEAIYGEERCYLDISISNYSAVNLIGF